MNTDSGSAQRSLRVIALAAVLGAFAFASPAPLRTAASPVDPAGFAVGVPTVVDPIRAAGEPDIVVDNNNNSLISGPGGTGTQTSYFWRTADNGQTFHLLGPSGGHYICPASGGGDSLGVIDRNADQIYLTDQEALADLGLSRLDAATNKLAATECANAPAVGADRPFEAVIPTANNVTPQSVADHGKPIVYLSWACQGCGGGAQSSGLAFGWSDDGGLTWHPADPGVADGNLAAQDFSEGGTLSAFEWHGNMVADPTTGDVFTAISCNPGQGCPNASGKNEIGVAVGVPGTAPTLGSFASVSYHTTCAGAVGCNAEGSLFPVIGMDSNHTLYEFWNEGNASQSAIPVGDTEQWHEYYSYSLDTPDHLHSVWSAPIRVDTGAVQSAVYGWMAVGDPGKLGFIFLGSSVRESPNASDATRQWHVFMSETTNATAALPTFQQTQVGIGPNHLKDICLQGTVGCIQNVGNRNMADFISVDIGPDGALQGTWANDSNQLHTNPTTLIPGLPITETARQVSGPKLIGSGSISDSRFSTVPTAAGVSDTTGEAVYPVDGGTANQKPLDLTASQVTFDGTNVVVSTTVADASSLVSPDTTNQSNSWWLTTWQFNHTIYFAKVEADTNRATKAAGPISCTAGVPTSYDRPGLNGQTVATLANYSGGTAVSGCTLNGNTFTITVPASVVGSPVSGDVLESTAAYTVLDNGAPPQVGPGADNVPTVVDATPAYDALLVTPPVNTPESPLAAGLLLGGGAIAFLYFRRRKDHQAG